jgi:hypothetical protein
MTGSKRVDHWTIGTVYECSEIAGSPQGSPPTANYVGCEAGRRTCSEGETERGKLCEIKWDYLMMIWTMTIKLLFKTLRYSWALRERERGRNYRAHKAMHIKKRTSISSKGQRDSQVALHKKPVGNRKIPIVSAPLPREWIQEIKA